MLRISVLCGSARKQKMRKIILSILLRRRYRLVQVINLIKIIMKIWRNGVRS